MAQFDTFPEIQVQNYALQLVVFFSPVIYILFLKIEIM